MSAPTRWPTRWPRSKQQASLCWPPEWRLTPLEAAFLAELVRRPTGVTFDGLLDAIYGNDPNGGPEGRTVWAVWACRCRQKTGYKIYSVPSVGYRLDVATRTALLAHYMEPDADAS